MWLAGLSFDPDDAGWHRCLVIDDAIVVVENIYTHGAGNRREAVRRASL